MTHYLSGRVCLVRMQGRRRGRSRVSRNGGQARRALSARDGPGGERRDDAVPRHADVARVGGGRAEALLERPPERCESHVSRKPQLAGSSGRRFQLCLRDGQGGNDRHPHAVVRLGQVPGFVPGLTQNIFW